jgi:hypothetical protein
MARVLGDAVNLGLDYEAYKNSDSFTGFLGLRLEYGLILLVSILGIGAVIWLVFGKVSNPTKEKFENRPMFKNPVPPSK